MSRMTRRRFLQYGAAGGAAIILPWRLGGRALAAIPGGTLDPGIIPKYRLPLVIPPAMPLTPKNRRPKGLPRNVDYYEIAVRQFRQQILPAGMPKTTVWGHGSVNHPGTFNYPAFTVEARTGRAVRVKWINGLVDRNGDFLPHLLPVDRDVALGQSTGRRGRSRHAPVLRVDARRLRRAGADGDPPAWGA